MSYEVTLIRCGRTKTVIVRDVKSEGEAKRRALRMIDESGFTVSRTVLMG